MAPFINLHVALQDLTLLVRVTLLVLLAGGTLQRNPNVIARPRYRRVLKKLR
jgi:hypothetical protein